MVTAFLITTLVLFTLNLGISLILIALKAATDDGTIISNIIGVVVSLIMITWNIFALVSL